jgi:hypothetical protein
MLPAIDTLNDPDITLKVVFCFLLLLRGEVRIEILNRHRVLMNVGLFVILLRQSA